MATRKNKKRDGLTPMPHDGVQKKFLARLVGYDPVSKRQIVDSERVIYARNKADALQQREALIAAAVAAKLGESASGGKLRFSEALEQWLKTVTRHSTLLVWGSYGRRVAKDFGDRWLHKISDDELERWLNRQKGARSTIMGIRMMLVNLYAWAIKNGHATKPNVAELTRVERKRHTSDVAAKLAELETPKKRALTEDELGVYLDAHRELFPHTYPLVYTMLSLATRYSEVSVLKRADIDWRTGQLVIRRSHKAGRLGPPKGDKARPAALAASCLELLRGHVAASEPSEWLFPRPAVWHGKAGLLKVWSYSTIYNHLKASMEHAEVRTDNATHAMRNTLKQLMEGVVPDAVLRKVIGHSNERVHAIYGDPQTLKYAKAVERRVLSGGKKKTQKNK